MRRIVVDETLFITRVSTGLPRRNQWAAKGVHAAACRVMEERRPAPKRLSRLLTLLGVVAAMILMLGNSPSPSPADTLHSGTEGTKAALVRIELRAVAEIAHIDHGTGEVEIDRGRSTVPLDSATGVLISADGIVATTWENLSVDEHTVAVYAANELFADVIGVPVVGNDGDPARHGTTPDQHWNPHLQHCYHQVTHCVLFHVPQYHVRTYTSEPGGVMAELLNRPSEPHDVALLRISGGGGAPTATLAPPDAEPVADTVLLGLTERPAPESGPVEIPTTVDAAAGRISSTTDLAAALDAGASGGPVLDPGTGEVLGLAGPRQSDGSATLVPAGDIQAAMTDTGLEATPSKFDAVFRRGIDHLSSGNPGGSAESALEESLTYYDSALATSHLDRARTLSAEEAADDPAAAASDTSTDEGPLPAALLPVLTGALLLAGVVGAIILRRRGAFAAVPVVGRSASRGARRPVASSATAAPMSRTGAGRGRTTAAPGGPKDATHDRRVPERAADLGHRPSGPRQSRASAAPARSAPDVRPGATATPEGDETRAAGALAPRAVDGTAPAFCSQCGRSLPSGARFCAGCGRPVG